MYDSMYIEDFDEKTLSGALVPFPLFFLKYNMRIDPLSNSLPAPEKLDAIKIHLHSIHGSVF